MLKIFYKRFSNYLEVPARIPKFFWHLLRLTGLIALGGLLWLIRTKPDIGNALLWDVIIPVLPLVFFIMPGFWRNVCPAAVINQIPRRLRLSINIKLNKIMRIWSYTIAMVTFFMMMYFYPLITQQSLTLLIMLGSLLFILIMGLLFEGKSGWCGTFCPMAPIERLFGHTPIIATRNAFCETCVGCQKNCMDFLPRAALISDVYDVDSSYQSHRTFFIAILPGFLFGFFMTEGALITPLYMLAYSVSSLGVFHIAKAYIPISFYRLNSLFSFTSFGIFYYFMIPNIFTTLDEIALKLVAEKIILPKHVVILSQEFYIYNTYGFLVFLMVIAMLISYAQELRFSIPTTYPNSPKVDIKKIAQLIREYTNGMSVTEETNNFTFSIFEGQTLLHALERSEFHIESGCRMGLCGSDPVAITDGAANLSPISPEEADTLSRLGLTGQARLACMVKVNGSIGISVNCFSPNAQNLSKNPKTDIGWGMLDIPHHKKGIPDPLKNKKIVIVGNGIAGMSATQYLRRLSPEANITVISNEIFPFYNRMGLTKLLENRLYSSDNMVLLPPIWYEQQRITQMLNNKIAHIDTNAKTLSISPTEIVPYDSLVLAIGAKARQPDIPNINTLEGCFSVRNMEDILEISNSLSQTRIKNVAILGGGWLGIEIAVALKKRNLNVTLIHIYDHLLNKIGNRTASTILENFLKNQRINIIYETNIARISGSGKLEKIHLTKDDKSLATELCIFTIGMVPHTDFIGRSSIKCGSGILVNRKMQTSEPDIYAVGDCVELTDEPLGLWGASMEMGKVAALNLAGIEKDFNTDNCYLPYILKVPEIDFRAFGQTTPDEGDKVFEEHDKNSNKYWFVVVNEHNYIVGGVFVNHTEMSNSLFKAMRFRLDASKLLPNSSDIETEKPEAMNATTSIT